MFRGGSAVSSVSRPFFFPPALPLWNSRPHHTIGSSWDRNIKAGTLGCLLNGLKDTRDRILSYVPTCRYFESARFFPKAKIETLVVNLVNMEAPPASAGISASVAVSWKSSSWLEVNSFQDNCTGNPRQAAQSFRFYSETLVSSLQKFVSHLMISIFAVIVRYIYYTTCW